MTILKGSNISWSKCDPSVQEDLRAWYRRNPGKWLAELETELLSDVLSDLFGYYLLQIGQHNGLAYLDSSRISVQLIASERPAAIQPEQESEQSRLFLRASTEHFPFAADSLDVLILKHTLEFSQDPHQVLRETDRTLIPEGHVVVMGFNPWSLWMLWRLVLGWRKQPPWCGRFIRQARLKDWLQLLGFDIVRSQTYFFRPPMSGRKVMKKLRFMDKLGARLWPILGGAYMVVAKKRVATLTPIKPRWRPRRSGLIQPGLAGNSSVSNREKKQNSTDEQN